MAVRRKRKIEIERERGRGGEKEKKEERKTLQDAVYERRREIGHVFQGEWSKKRRLVERHMKDDMSGAGIRVHTYIHIYTYTYTHVRAPNLYLILLRVALCTRVRYG